MASSSPTPSSSSTTQSQCASAVDVANFVSTKLHLDQDSNDYMSWKQQMLCLIESQDLLGFIDGEIPPPSSEEKGKLLKGWILSALSDGLVQTLVEFDSARDVWLELEKKFTQSIGSAPPSPAAEHGSPPTPADEHGTPPTPADEHGTPPTPADEHGTPPSPAAEHGTPPSPAAEHGTPPTPADEHGTPPSPADEHGTPPSPATEHGTPPSPASEHGTPPSPAAEHGTPPTPADDHGEDWHKYLPLYRAALRGEWDTARSILDQDPDAIKARVACVSETALDIAVGTKTAIPFVANLVNLMSDDLLAITDELGYNALHVAARTGNTEAAKILVERVPALLYVPCRKGWFPVHEAVVSSHRDTVEYLISQTRDDMEPDPFSGESGLWLLNLLIDADFFDVALHLVEKYPHLAVMKPHSGLSALEMMALKEVAFPSGVNFNFWERLIYSSVQLEMASEIQYATPQSSDIENPTCSTLVLGELQRWHRVVQKLYSTFWKVIKRLVPRVKGIHEKKLMHQQALRLVKCLCKFMESLNFMEALCIYNDAMLTAARLGIQEVIEVIVETFPDAIYSQDTTTKQNIFHLAVQNRCEKVFNLIYQISQLKHEYSNARDSSRNTILHLAASLAPPHKLNFVSGAALQMQREIHWFKEAENFVHPAVRGWPNCDGKTPKMIFTEQHQNLKAEGEKWMKDTANSCTISAALIATVVFAAAITVPGGNVSETGYPMFSKSGAFTIFAVSDAVSLFTSTTSLLMFLSILTSRYAEEDFLYALPKRLCIGLVTLFVSILFMMAAFSSTLYLVFGRQNAWVLTPVAALACLPITSFVLLQFPLLVDVISSTYGRGIFGKQSDRPFY